MRTLALGLLFTLVGCSRSFDRVPGPDSALVPALADSNAVSVPSEAEADEAVTFARAAAHPAPASGRCPADMILVEGQYCPNVRQECVDWIDDPLTNPYARCGRFKETECRGARVPMAFCIDREEYSPPKETLPQGDLSWNEAKKQCETDGKRLCQESEWTFACEGEDAKPYPYGYERDASVCNFEKTDLVEKGKMRDLRQPRTENLQCLSTFGVHNMVGNIDEWVVLDKPHFSEKNGGRKMMSGLKGGWWGPLRNRCRPVTVDHDEYFHELQTGFRCCAEAQSPQQPQASR